jgi:hypothetical protein
MVNKPRDVRRMIIVSSRLLLGLGAALLLPTIAYGQQSCRGADDEAGIIRSILEAYVTAPANSGSDGVRQRLQLPAGPASSIVQVANDSLCAVANTAYRAHFQPLGGSGFSDRVYVFQIGTMFVVQDPEYVYNTPGFTQQAVFTSQWAFVGIFR